MRILYFDTNADNARQLYSQLLSYRGVQWDLVHCQSHPQINDWLEREEFDLLLLAAYEQHRWQDDFASQIKRTLGLPIVALVDTDDLDEHIRLVNLGINDCVKAQQTNGAYIMRRLRMAASRFHRSRGVIASVTSRTMRQQINATATAAAASTSETLLSTSSVAQSAQQLAEPARDPQSSVSVLVIDDRSTHQLSDSAATMQCKIETADNIEMATSLIRESRGRIDAVVTEQGVIEREGIDRLEELRVELDTTPILMLMMDRSDSAAINFTDLGVDDCLIAALSSPPVIERAVRLSIARELCVRSQLIEAVRDLDIADRRAAPRDDSDRRETSRYLVTRPVMAIPVLPNGAPDKGAICEAFTVDISTTGVAFQVSSKQTLPNRHWVLGIESMSEDHRQDFHFANVEIKNVKYLSTGIRMGSRFRHEDDDLLRRENRLPSLKPKNHRMAADLPTHILDEWTSLGVLRPRLIGRIKSCPECKAVACLGDGCRQCGSLRVEFRELIHHFACAYIGDRDEFENDQGISCPKCMARSLVAGVDFEIIPAHYNCVDCRFESNELEQVCSCLQCHLRFPLRMAADEEVYGYDVDRLDVLAFLSSAT